MLMLCRQASSQLIVIDLQTTLLNTLQVDEKKPVIKNTNTLITAACLLDIPVLVTEQYPKGLGRTDSTLSASIENSAVDKKSILEKTRFSCVGAEGFSDTLANSTRNQFILCGIEAHVCVLQTAIDLIGLGKEVFVVQDAVCSRSSTNKKNALTRIRQCGGVISNIESVLFEWLEDATHPHFKKIISMIR